MYLCNKERYGYLNVPAKPHQTVEDDRLNFVHVQLESMSKSRLRSLLILLTTDADYWECKSNQPFTLFVKQSMVLQCARPDTSICSLNRETSWALMR